MDFVPISTCLASIYKDSHRTRPPFFPSQASSLIGVRSSLSNHNAILDGRVGKPILCDGLCSVRLLLLLPSGCSRGGRMFWAALLCLPPLPQVGLFLLFSPFSDPRGQASCTSRSTTTANNTRSWANQRSCTAALAPSGTRSSGARTGWLTLGGAGSRGGTASSTGPPWSLILVLLIQIKNLNDDIFSHNQSLIMMEVGKLDSGTYTCEARRGEDFFILSDLFKKRCADQKDIRKNTSEKDISKTQVRRFWDTRPTSKASPRPCLPIRPSGEGCLICWKIIDILTLWILCQYQDDFDKYLYPFAIF